MMQLYTQYREAATRLCGESAERSAKCVAPTHPLPLLKPHTHTPTLKPTRTPTHTPTPRGSKGAVPLLNVSKHRNNVASDHQTSLRPRSGLGKSAPTFRMTSRQTSFKENHDAVFPARLHAATHVAMNQVRHSGQPAQG